METCEVTVEISEALIKTAARRFWWKFIGRTTVLAGILLLICAVPLYTGVETRHHKWLLITAGTGAWVVLLGLMAYFVPLRRSLATFRAMKEGKVTWKFEQDKVCITSDLGKNEVAWRIFRKVWRFPEAWLLFTTSPHYATLPTTGLSPELLEFVAKKIQESGGKVS